MTLVHYFYIFFVIAVFTALILKKEIVLPCFVGIFVIGWMVGGNVITGITAMYNALILAGSEFWPIILIISLVVSMSKALSFVGADVAIASPLRKLMINKDLTFLIIGFIMLVCSLVIWPSPAVALVGGIILPFASKLGLNPIWIAVAMNIFGHGMGLSADYFIQGAPTVTATSANLTATDIMKASFPIWLVMSLSTLAVAFIMMKLDSKSDKPTLELQSTAIDTPTSTFKAKALGIFTILVFMVDLFLLVNLKLTGGDATAVIGGSVIIVSIVCLFSSHSPRDAMEACVDNLKDGFAFGIRVFAPVIVIGGFFFMGNGDMAPKILSGNEISILNDISFSLSNTLGLSPITAVFTQCAIAITAGLDGSGFSGLPIVGSIAYSFGQGMDISVPSLAAFGQIITIWVGGGTVIPWAVVPVAAICKVSPNELARKNIIPVVSGIIITTIYMCLTL